MSDGYTLSYRRKWDNPVFRNKIEVAIWGWMCDMAAWRETIIRFNGEMLTLQRGQLATSRRYISEGFGIGEQVTRTFLENLEKAGMVNQQPTHKGTVLTICNYDEYQPLQPSANPPDNQDLTHGQPTANPNKNEDNEKKKERVSSGPRATRLSIDTLPEPWESFCRKERPDLDPMTVFAVFFDHWTSKAGKDATRLDWFATWRNWVRREKSNLGGRNGQPQKSKLDLAAEGIRRAAAKREQREQTETGQPADGLFRGSEALWP